MLRTTVAAIAVACMLATAAGAEEAGTMRVSEACQGELASFCADAKGEGKGRGRHACLQQNEAKLSQQCAAAVRTARESREKVRTACEADRARHCKDVDGKGGAAMQCLRAKQTELSKPCAEAIAALPQRTAKN